MTCPACGGQLQEERVEDEDIDVCMDCGGMWFDNFELKSFDEVHEGGEKLFEMGPDSPVSVNQDKDYYCPRCSDIILKRHFFGVQREVEVDECPSCGGHWLDDGELKAIRKIYKTQENKKKQFEDWFDDKFADRL